MSGWSSQFDFSAPFWDEFRPLLQQLGGPGFPGADTLCRLLPDGLTSHGGGAIRFVAANELPAADYEQHIYTTGEVSTRENNWHDLFNAMMWSRFPHLKAAMNAMHVRRQKSRLEGGRGKQRDALTLLDESGAIVVGWEKKHLESAARHDWHGIFQAGPFEASTSESRGGLRIFLCGHALLEKFLRPYKAITAKILLIHLNKEEFSQSQATLMSGLDLVLAEELMGGRILRGPEDLSPLPLTGIPGWWKDTQDSDFYADERVFRPPRKGLVPAPIFHLPR